MSDPESPLERFKQATAATVRAVAEQDEVDVSFSNEPPGLSGKRVRLPVPMRDLNPTDVAHVRGEADSQALRLRHHDAKIHSVNMPGGDVAPARECRKAPRWRSAIAARVCIA